MADVSFGSLSVQNAAKVGTFTAGAAIGEGDACYVASGKYYPGQCDGTDAEADVKVIAITAAAGDGSFFVGMKTGSKLGDSATPFTAGASYYLSATAGGICPFADLASTNKTVIIGTASTTAILDVNIVNTGIAQP